MLTLLQGFWLEKVLSLEDNLCQIGLIGYFQSVVNDTSIIYHFIRLFTCVP